MKKLAKEAITLPAVPCPLLMTEFFNNKANAVELLSCLMRSLG
jgi:hypothetical protein